MTIPLKLAVAGLGTVGTGLLRLLEQQAALLEIRCSRRIEVTAVSARDRTRDRGVDLSGVAWFDSAKRMAGNADADVIVELIGGENGIAKDVCEAAIAGGRAVVTANKALVAHHGTELARAAEKAGVTLNYEAAVAGGIPIVKALREGLAGNRVSRIYGILNGTCNYILSEMERTGADFDAMLAEAQAKGFAEADPTFDIEGVDAAHKLAILSAIGFGARVDFANVDATGIGEVRAADITQAGTLGYVVRLVGIASIDESDGTPALLQRVRPCLVARGHPLAAVTGPTNAVVAEGNFSGRLLFQGAGAGAGPTASAVVADLIDIARGDLGAPFSVPVEELETFPPADPGNRIGRDYIRFTVTDRPGVLAEITAAMRDAEVSIESLIQRGRDHEGGEVLVAMVTHEGPERCVTKALELLEGSPSLTAPPLVMPILKD